MLEWFQRLLPREQVFFPLLVRHASMITAAAESLQLMLEGGAGISDHCRSVMRYEEEADRITRDVLIGVRSTFITPFDRGDIKDLIGADVARGRCGGDVFLCGSGFVCVNACMRALCS